MRAIYICLGFGAFITDRFNKQMYDGDNSDESKASNFSTK